MIQLEKYHGKQSRFTCPKCNSKNSFVRYQNENGEYLSYDVGRCNRESSCGYHKKPKDFFIENVPIENRLKAIACEFEVSLIADFTDEERNKFINEVKEDYGKFNLTEELTKKCLIRKMYQKYKLPELTLFSF